MIVSKKTLFLVFVLVVFDIFAYKAGIFIKAITNTAYSAVYNESLMSLTIEHIVMVILATFSSVLIGIFLGVLATRNFSRNLLYPINLISSVAQSFPPVAVLALTVSMVGFGVKPTIIALFIYGLFPIIQNTITGIESIDESIKESSLGMGMDGATMLFKVELPLAFLSILAGIKTTTTINIGVAAIGAVVGAGGLGALIISGLINENQFFIAYGTISVALLSIIFDSMLSDLEAGFAHKYREL
jgi:osmoprotectant transport system permease protein